MKIFRWLSNTLNSIDTITTKLLILVLCCITIPLTVLAFSSGDIIKQSIYDNTKVRLEINKNIFKKKLSDELNILHNYLIAKINGFEAKFGKKYGLGSKKFIDYMQGDELGLDFVMVLNSQKNLSAYSGSIEKTSILNRLSRIIPIAYIEKNLLFMENIENDIFEIAISPVYKNNEVSSIVIIGKSLKNSEIVNYVNSITGATVAAYTSNNRQANFIALSDNISGLNNFLEVSHNPNPDLGVFQFDGNNIINPTDFYTNFLITNFFNRPIGSVYLGIPRYDFMVWADKNSKFIGIIGIISMLVAIIIAALFARKITDPILALKEAAESINLGNLDYKVEIRGNDETVKLAKSFNQMVSNLERDERLRNNFIATLTHDLKVPMLAENQTITFLLSETYGPLTKDQREVLDLIRSTNSSSLEMIGTLLEVYRYDWGNVKLFTSEFDLVELTKESINQIKSLAEDKKIQININSLEEKVIVTADKRDIKRLIHNLVSNSINHGILRGFLNCNIEVINGTIKYIPKSDTEYYTSLKGPIEITDSAIVSIEDNGVGIASEDMPLLFKRFSLSKGRKPAGSGLGLYYASQVIGFHKGHIWAESSETGGCTFKFTLPLNRQG